MSAQKSAQSGPELEELPFEEALNQLEGLVDALEAGDLDLEASLQKFEHGVKLVRVCSERLRAAELRIQQLEGDIDGPGERPLDLEEDA